MPKEFSRTKRVAAQVQRELAQLIQFEVNDPRIGLVTVSGVEISKDLAYAKVYVTALNDDHNVEEVLQGLNSAAGFMRRELGKRIKLRLTPELSFLYDATTQQGADMNTLIKSAIDADQKEN